MAGRVLCALLDWIKNHLELVRWQCTLHQTTRVTL